MRKRNIPFGRAVRARWYDSMSLGGWNYNTQTAGEVAKIQSLGYVVKCSDEALCMTTSIGHRGGAIDVIAIPWRCIVDLSLLGREWDRL